MASAGSVALRNVSKRFGEVVALDEASLLRD
jgi:ABC-type sugar transport system ATPase subunit